VVTGVALIEAIRAAAPDTFGWRPPPYEYEHDKDPIAILAGSPALRTAIDEGVGADEIAAAWPGESADFARLRQHFLLYR
jgi:uncharacterized protein YbbC (DUF1343 family)